MKKYAYYPGCSLEKIASSYHKSTLETTRIFDIDMQELDDWNCCGATTYFHVDGILAHTLVARNLALAEKEGLDLVAPCSACYKNAYFTNKLFRQDPDLAEHINFALEEDDLQFHGEIDVYHLIDVFANDVGPEKLKEKVTNPLKGLNIAPYYGCQIVRPRKNGEEVENPQFFEDLIEAVTSVVEELQDEVDPETVAKTLKEIRETREKYVSSAFLIEKKVKPATDMISKIVNDMNLGVSADGVLIAPDYGTSKSGAKIGKEAEILLPTHRSVEGNLFRRVCAKYDAVLDGLKKIED